MGLRHVIAAQQFDRAMLEDLFKRADQMKPLVDEGGSDLLRRRVMATLFWEPSTRTRLSFESAMIRLGGHVIGTESAGHFSSIVKGESIKDMVRVAGRYADVIVIRHPTRGTAEEAAEKSSVPVINAGDGDGQHPTQALLDVYTIQEELGHIDGVTVAFTGDLVNGRTVRSLAYLLAKFKPKKLYFVAAKTVGAPNDILEYLTRHTIDYEVTESLSAIAHEVDILYVTRLQRERITGSPGEFEKAYLSTLLTPEIVARMRPHARILHPLPRNEEIPEAIDDDPRAAYFRQSNNGLFIRMALLKMILVG